MTTFWYHLLLTNSNLADFTSPQGQRQETLADNVVLKQFLEKIILSKTEPVPPDSLPKAVVSKI